MWEPISAGEITNGEVLDPNASFGLSLGAEPMAGGMNAMGGLLKALQGVKAPEAPQLQRLSTPNAPMPSAPAPRAPTPVRGDQFMQLIQLLGNGPVAAGPTVAPLQPRLSQALGIR